MCTRKNARRPMRLSTLILTGLICLCLMTSAACSKKTDRILFLPPENLLADIEIPEEQAKTNGELYLHYLELRHNARLKNAELLSLRLYRQKLLHGEETEWKQ